MTRKELANIDKYWEIQRYATKGHMVIPLLTHEEWNTIWEMTGMNWANWEELVMGGNGPMPE